MASKFTAPNMDNATPGFVIDQSGKLSVGENYAKKMRKFLKEWLFTREGISVDTIDANEPKQIQGDEIFIATIAKSMPERFDQKAFKEAYPDLYEQFKTRKPQLRMTFALKDGVVNPKAQAILNEIMLELDLDGYDEEA